MVSVSQLSGDQCSSFLCSKGFLPSPLVVLLFWVGCVGNVWQWGSKCWKSCNGPGSVTAPCARCICPWKSLWSSLRTDNSKAGRFHCWTGTGTMSVNFHHWQELALLPLGWKKCRRVVSEGTWGMATNPDYTFMSEVARDILIVNDCAERNIIRPLQTKYASHGMSMDC